MQCNIFILVSSILISVSLIMGYQYVRAVVMVIQLRYEINAYRH